MLRCAAILLFALAAQAAPQAPGPVPTQEEVRKGMGISSKGDLRGQQDSLGYAHTAEQMGKVWSLAEAGPQPEGFGPLPGPGVVGAILPHDDYLFAGRVYRRAVPLITAKTVVLVGAFHRYRRFQLKDQLVFEGYRAWRAPQGEVPVSSLREAVLAGLKPGEAIRVDAAHDGEHSLEAIAYWLRQQRPDLEILPLLVPAMGFERMQTLSADLAPALAKAMAAKGLKLGRDVAVVISTDGVHYGEDFKHTPFGAGGPGAYLRACEVDRALMTGPLSGPLEPAKARAFFEAVVDPTQPDTYRLTWCGRFSVPFGMLLLADLAKALGEPIPMAHPVAYGTSIGSPELPLKPLGMQGTAPANLYHFVGHPAVAISCK